MLTCMVSAFNNFPVRAVKSASKISLLRQSNNNDEGSARTSPEPSQHASSDSDSPMTKAHSISFESVREVRSRSQYLAKFAAQVAAVTAGTSALKPAAAKAEANEYIDIPLEWFDGTLCMRYEVSNPTADQPLNKAIYRGIVDTGSPFLIVPSVFSREWGGNPSPIQYIQSGFEPTVEIFGGQDYDTNWDIGDVRLASTAVVRNLIFASVGSDVLLPPGGVFVGLIKYKQKRIRPTFLEQLGYSSFRIDAKRGNMRLAKRAMLPKYPQCDAIPLLDLRPIGDPVNHYATRVADLFINGRPVRQSANTYAVFDTGTTGCAISEEV